MVIGCDTVITIDNEIIGKPKDPDDAFQILKRYDRILLKKHRLRTFLD